MTIEDHPQGEKASPAVTGLKSAITWTAWPGLMTLCIAITAYGMANDEPILGFNSAYLLLGVTLILLERWMPYEKTWLENDGQTFANIAHTLLNKGMVQAAAAVTTLIIVVDVVEPEAGALWPTDWPQWAQIVLGLLIAEFGFYWAHRLAHEVPWLWPFHAVHHSVTRLWVINTGRFHFVDTALSVALSQPLLYLAGAPVEVFMWVGGITAFSGLLTHTNVVMRAGWLNYVFNTPELHRWHHSKVVEEGNTNYGEVLMVYDLLFGTWFLPDRRPPAGIGISEQMPTSFAGQLAHPFRTLSAMRRERAAANVIAGD
ncbi:sterol desaturase family protein [Pyruvatibacter mobilis]|uniref:sterol desaturase family protein n=1 Tax=Pyruvatibacter mobilis TaxID=1712261 RepID=UPI003BACCDAC